jgi:hypothetical protein
LPFEVVSMLLLAAMVGCIVIAMKSPSTPSAKGKELGEGKKSITQTFHFADEENKNVLPVSRDPGGTSL